MTRQEIATALGVSTNTIKNWFGNMGLEVPKDFDAGHVTLLEIYKMLSSKEPKLPEDKIIGGCLPFMKAAKVVPVDPATHPLTAGGAPTGGSAEDSVDPDNSFAGLIAESMEEASVELAPVAASALVRGLFNRRESREVFKVFVGERLRVGVDNWLGKYANTLDVTPVPDGVELPGEAGQTVALPAADEQVKE